MKKAKVFYLDPTIYYDGNRGPAIRVEEDGSASLYMNRGERVTGLRICDIAWMYECARVVLRKGDVSDDSIGCNICRYNTAMRRSSRIGRNWLYTAPVSMIATYGGTYAEEVRRKYAGSTYFRLPQECAVTDSRDRETLFGWAINGLVLVFNKTGEQRKKSRSLAYQDSWSLFRDPISGNFVEHNLLRVLDYMMTDEVED